MKKWLLALTGFSFFISTSLALGDSFEEARAAYEKADIPGVEDVYPALHCEFAPIEAIDRPPGLFGLYTSLSGVGTPWVGLKMEMRWSCPGSRSGACISWFRGSVKQGEPENPQILAYQNDELGRTLIGYRHYRVQEHNKIVPIIEIASTFYREGMTEAISDPTYNAYAYLVCQPALRTRL